MFSVDDYKAILQGKLAENRGQRGYQRRLAAALGCHTSFISQVANGPTHCTPDHAAALCEFWGLDDDETSYFMLLVDLARASTPRLRRLIERRLGDLRRKRTKVSQRIGPKVEASAWYYSGWHISAIHVLLSVPGFSNAAKVAARLGLPEALVTKTLATLALHKIVREHHGRWEVVAHDLHVPGGSTLVALHHANWRRYAMHNYPSRGEAGTHYTSLLGISRQHFSEIQELTLRYIAETRRLAVASGEEDVYCMNVDLFPI